MREIIAISFVCFFLSSCLIIPFVSNSNTLLNTVSRRNDLMPFERNGKLGYINSETFEVVIPEKYRSAEHFIGDFAIVERISGRPFIINRNNKKILGSFNHVSLFDTENGAFVFALVGKNKDRRLYTYSDVLFSFTRLEPTSIKYSLYNVTTRKKVMNFGTRDYPNTSTYIPRIRFYGNYMTYETNDRYTTFNKDVYEIQSNGSIKKTDMDIDELISKIAAERNLQFNEIDVRYPNYTDYAHDWKFNGFGYFNALDMNKLNEHIPDDLELREMHLIGDFIYPLKDKQLFQVYLRTKGTRYGPTHTGLYDAIENKWQIHIMKGSSSEKFSYGANDDWIIYTDSISRSDVSFYNLKTRKKYKNLYKILVSTWIYCPMAYYGYTDDPWAKDAIVEDF